jgi:cyclopropane fatty-acyl-phospholipid synthase-like methyltransferase
MVMSRGAQVYADFLEAHLSSRTHLLDVGCGSGELSLDLGGSVGHVTGVDVEEQEIEDAGRTARRDDIEMLTSRWAMPTFLTYPTIWSMRFSPTQSSKRWSDQRKP